MDIKTIHRKAGGCARIAEALGIDRSSILRWKAVPDKHLVQIESIFGIKREHMRPDLYAGLIITRPDPPTKRKRNVGNSPKGV